MDLTRFGLLSISIVMVAMFLTACGEDKDPVTHKEKPKEEPDGITMATPNGGELKSAVEGPVRSALGEPEVNLDTYRLRIDGLVDSSYALSWEEIQDMPASYTDTMIMYCVEGWEVWGNWKGIMIKDLLDKAHLQSEGEYILFESRDGYKTALPVSYLETYNAMLAYEVNNAPLQKHDGFPLRLIAFGKYGYKWAKWVTRLSVLDESQLGYWEKLGFSDQADVSLDRRRFYEGDTVKALVY
jgi:DMSO/TMAO reductase YedYZ molybdopterin-dependent catalytic subunit